MSAPIGMEPPPENASAGMVFGTARSRLARAIAGTRFPDQPPAPTFSESEATMARYRTTSGIENPYGTGLDAYEPNTLILDEYAEAFGQAQASRKQAELDKAIADASSATINFGGVGPTFAGDGKVGQMINAAMDLARRAVPYVWGGTTANGVDCSGLIYYAARAAGIDMPRYRAIDYGRMGTAVSLAEARPGDIVYYDNPNSTTDHVGIYIGNGKVIQAPQSGDHVRVTSVGNFTSIRRIFEDNLFGSLATPGGGTAVAYDGRPYNPSASAPSTPAMGSGTPTIQRTASSGYRVRAV